MRRETLILWHTQCKTKTPVLLARALAITIVVTIYQENLLVWQRARGQYCGKMLCLCRRSKLKVVLIGPANYSLLFVFYRHYNFKMSDSKRKSHWTITCPMVLKNIINWCNLPNSQLTVWTPYRPSIKQLFTQPHKDKRLVAWWQVKQSFPLIVSPRFGRFQWYQVNKLHQ